MKKEIIWFDIETTGVSVKNDRIVELCIMKDDTEFYYLLNPEIPILPEASEIHGITDDMVKDKPTFKELYREIGSIINPKRFIWGGYNNTSFDVPLMLNEFKRCGVHIDLEMIEILDVYKVWTSMSKRKLVDAYQHFCNKDLKDAHSASADIRATKEIFEKQKELWGEMDYASLSGKKSDTSSKLMKSDKGLMINFGKYKGVLIEDILKADKPYLVWLIRQDGFSESFKNEIRNEIERILD